MRLDRSTHGLFAKLLGVRSRFDFYKLRMTGGMNADASLPGVIHLTVYPDIAGAFNERR